MRDFQGFQGNGEEIERAEFHMTRARRGEPHPAMVAIALGVLLVLVASKSASAASTSSPGCSTQIKTVQFAGSFMLEGQQKLKAKPLRFVIGLPEATGADTVDSDDSAEQHSVAQIWSGGQCQATCSSVVYERGDLSLPISLDLTCRGEILGALSAHVAVLWDHGQNPSTSLRFGTWLEGYEQAQLKVEVDQFNSKNVADRMDVERSRKRRLIALRGR